MEEMVNVSKKELLEVLSHFMGDEINNAEEEYSITLDGSSHADMKVMEEEEVTDHIAYSLLKLRSQIGDEDE